MSQPSISLEYRPRDPAGTVLWRAVHDHWQTFVAEAARQARSLPAFVERAFEKFLDCGNPAAGFARVRCKDCGKEQFVAFSCKVRGLCPSCDGRRMAEHAAHLVDNVIPEVAVRQWVLTVPGWLRFRMARDNELTSIVLDVFIRTVSAWYRRRARRLGVDDPKCAAVTFIQRFGDGVRLSPHFHTLFADGCWSRLGDDWPIVFDEIPSLRDEEVAELCAELRRKILRRLIRKGVISDVGDGYDDPADEDALLTICGKASLLDRVAVGERLGQLVAHVMREPPEPKPHGRRCAHVQGFSLHAATRVGRKARPHLEKLCRYVARPAICNARLKFLDDGRILMRFKRKWANGAVAKVWEPLDFISKLVPMVVKPRVNLLRYHGQWASGGKWREEICPTPRQPEPCHVEDAPTPRARRRRISWSELLKRCFAVDVLTCSCGGQRELISLIEAGRTATKILAHVGLPTERPRFKAARAPPQAEFDDGWGQPDAYDPLDQCR